MKSFALISCGLNHSCAGGTRSQASYWPSPEFRAPRRRDTHIMRVFLVWPSLGKVKSENLPSSNWRVFCVLEVRERAIEWNSRNVNECGPKLHYSIPVLVINHKTYVCMYSTMAESFRFMMTVDQWTMNCWCWPKDMCLLIPQFSWAHTKKDPLFAFAHTQRLSRRSICGLITLWQSSNRILNKLGDDTGATRYLFMI